MLELAAHALGVLRDAGRTLRRATEALSPDLGELGERGGSARERTRALDPALDGASEQRVAAARAAADPRSGSGPRRSRATRRPRSRRDRAARAASSLRDATSLSSMNTSARCGVRRRAVLRVVDRVMEREEQRAVRALGELELAGLQRGIARGRRGWPGAPGASQSRSGARRGTSRAGPSRVSARRQPVMREGAALRSSSRYRRSGLATRRPLLSHCPSASSASASARRSVPSCGTSETASSRSAAASSGSASFRR